ncbi:MAG: hypothetical protein WDN27_02770 [Candidatus Saccharibacteria bacterium]
MDDFEARAGLRDTFNQGYWDEPVVQEWQGPLTRLGTRMLESKEITSYEQANARARAIEKFAKGLIIEQVEVA